MQLYVELDAAYLLLPNARSRRGGHFYPSDKLTSMYKLPQPKIS